MGCCGDKTDFAFSNNTTCFAKKKYAKKTEIFKNLI